MSSQNPPIRILIAEVIGNSKPTIHCRNERDGHVVPLSASIFRVINPGG